MGLQHRPGAALRGALGASRGHPREEDESPAWPGLAGASVASWPGSGPSRELGTAAGWPSGCACRELLGTAGVWVGACRAAAPQCSAWHMRCCVKTGHAVPRDWSRLQCCLAVRRDKSWAWVLRIMCKSLMEWTCSVRSAAARVFARAGAADSCTELAEGQCCRI